jgi:hypothetical protein
MSAFVSSFRWALLGLSIGFLTVGFAVESPSLLLADPGTGGHVPAPPTPCAAPKVPTGCGTWPNCNSGINCEATGAARACNCEQGTSTCPCIDS